MALKDESQMALLKTKQKRHKYNAKAVVLDGHRFQSTAEAARYVQLIQMLRAGTIKKLVLQPEFKFRCGTKYRPDFKIVCRSVTWFEDVKGKSTEAFKIKQKLMAEEYPRIDLQIIKIDSRVADTLVKGYLGAKHAKG